MRSTTPRWEPGSRRLWSPALVTALLWVGVQVLVLLYLRTLLGVSILREPQVAAALLESLAVAPAGGLAVRWWLLAVNLAFVVLLWIRERASVRAGRGRRIETLLVHGGTVVLLLLVQATWEAVLRVEVPGTSMRLPG